MGTALGITSAAGREGKSTHALALARTVALAGEGVVLVDADLRRCGTSRLLNRDFRFTLSDFLQDRCAAHDVIGIEEHSGVRVVPSAPTDLAWTSQGVQRFYDLIDYLKERFDVVIIDLPPIVGLAETIRLAQAADSIALVIRWGRTERQFVQFALDALRTARVSTIAVILNDIDLKAQRRRGYRDHSAVYASKELYRVTPGDREGAMAPLLPMAAAEAEPDVHSRTGSQSEPRRDDARRDPPRGAASDIEKLYNRHHE